MENTVRNQIFNFLLDESSKRRERDEAEKEEICCVIFAEISSSSSEESEYGQEQHIKCVNFLETIDAYSDGDFKSHMRLQRPTVEHLITTYSQSNLLPDPWHGRRVKIGPRKMVFMYIWYISNTVTFRQLGNLFRGAKSSAWIAVRRVSSWLISIGYENVKWPQGAAAEETQRKFEEKKRIPGVIGAIDCTHIRIKAPTVSKESYYSRKQHYSLILQAVVDANKKFIDITCGEPGSLHDSRVLRRSDLYARVQTNYGDLFPNESFILGDSAYPATSWLVPPFKDNGNLNDLQRRFNYAHSATRITVENAFGLLKGRFRRLLKFTEQTNLTSVSEIIVSACILHNICIINDDLYTESVLEQPDADASIPENAGAVSVLESTVDRRQLLLAYLDENNNKQILKTFRRQNFALCFSFADT